MPTSLLTKSQRHNLKIINDFIVKIIIILYNYPVNTESLSLDTVLKGPGARAPHIIGKPTLVV